LTLTQTTKTTLFMIAIMWFIEYTQIHSMTEHAIHTVSLSVIIDICAVRLLISLQYQFICFCLLLLIWL